MQPALNTTYHLADSFGWDRANWQAWCQMNNQPSFRATQMVQAIHQHGITDPQLISTIPKVLRDQLTSETNWAAPLTIMTEQVATDGTVKWLFRLSDGAAIETVFIPEDDRGTLCISSQVGCGLNCQFCATAVSGFSRHLSATEIIAQLWIARQRLIECASSPTWDTISESKAITNVVMMGMGEPMLNLDAVIPALSLMLDDHAYGLSKYRVTVSTSGVIPGMLLLKDKLPVSLAVSLHAPTDSLRTQLIPLNKKYPLSVLMDTCRDYFQGKAFPAHNKRKVVFEYVMLAGINDHLAEANQLAELLREIPHKLNLIPFNPFSGSHLQCSPWEDILAFQRQLQSKGSLCTIRKTRGQDIDAACGQLQGKFDSRIQRKITFYTKENKSALHYI